MDDELKGKTIDTISERFNHLASKNLQIYTHLKEERSSEIVRQLHNQVNNSVTVQSMTITYVVGPRGS